MPESRVHTQVCIAGGGPAGMMLGLLLAGAGIDVIVLEKHKDFFRDFRGDTIHPSTIDLLDQLGLRAQFDAIPQSPITTLDIVVNGNRMTPVDFRNLRGPNKHIALMPQWDFLSLLADAGRNYPHFQRIMNAEVVGVLRAAADSPDNDRITGVRATTPDGPVTITAELTVAADGRDSIVRESSGLVTRDYGVAVDLLWFRVPKPAVTPPDTLAYLNAESMVITIPRTDYYQSGMLVAKGGFPAVQAAGIDEFHARTLRVAPFLGDAIDVIQSWDQVKLLTVQVNRLDRWWLPGLLCIGDAAHAMSPAFGVGVNYAVQDAVAAANLLVGPLRAGTLSTDDLDAVQQRRLPPVATMQPIQLRLHSIIAKPGGGGFLPNPMHWWQRAIAAVLLPILRRVSARIVGRGFRPERIDPGVLAESSGQTEPAAS